MNSIYEKQFFASLNAESEGNLDLPELKKMLSPNVWECLVGMANDEIVKQVRWGIDDIAERGPITRTSDEVVANVELPGWILTKYADNTIEMVQLGPNSGGNVIITFFQ